MAASAKQDAFVGRVEAVLSSARLHRFAASTTERRWERLARYTWNVSICEAFYPLLHFLEIVLRNRVYDHGASSYPLHGTRHIASWLDADPPHLTPYAVQEVENAKKKLFRSAKRPGALEHRSGAYNGGDLVAALDFGFWTGLFSRHYLFQNSRDRRLWPHGFTQVFPYAPSRIALPTISGRLNGLRQLRNRAFHHEPIWARPNLAGDRDNILQLLDWMSPETARVARATERLSEVVSDDYRRCLRARIYQETRR
ncbi:MAG TPA: hypothetical protein VF665_12385 [Longimicrobium sp.]|jgi:hypothetical protein|uniref:hypothetical protein n=1 Tax=Longimicrobium sp. TaxID=2029185 RepID=UPI002EDA4640